MTAKNRFLEVHGKAWGAVQAVESDSFEDEYIANNDQNIMVYEIKDAAKGCFVVSFQRKDLFCVELWRSKLIKKPETYSFRKPESRLAYVNKWIDNRQKREQSKVETRKINSETGSGLQVGDVLSATWGYEQTNYNYYEVTKIIGKSMVEIREIKQMIEETEWMQGKCAPAPGEYIGEPMRRKAKNGGLRVTDCIYASKMSYTEVAGVRLYEAGHYTSYH